MNELGIIGNFELFSQLTLQPINSRLAKQAKRGTNDALVTISNKNNYFILFVGIVQFLRPDRSPVGVRWVRLVLVSFPTLSPPPPI